MRLKNLMTLLVLIFSQSLQAAPQVNTRIATIFCPRNVSITMTPTNLGSFNAASTSMSCDLVPMPKIGSKATLVNGHVECICQTGSGHRWSIQDSTNHAPGSCVVRDGVSFSCTN